MPKRGENIRKRKDGRWEGRYICDRDINGKAVYRSVYAKSYTEVRQRLTEAKGKAFQRTKKSPARTFGDASQQWLTACSLRLKPSTVTKYSSMLQKHILPIFKNANLSLITEEYVADFIEEKRKTLSDSSVRSILTTIKSVMKYARKQGWCDDSIIELRLPVQPKREVSALSDIEREKLESYLLDDMDNIKLGLYLCLYTGLRVGELCALRWMDIDLSHKMLHVTATMQRIKQSDNSAKGKTAIIITTPKSKSSVRSIPLPAPLVMMLRKFKAEDSCFLLSGNMKPVEPRIVQYRFKKAAQQLNLSYSNTHVMRHTFATRCIELGFDVKTLSELLGHSRVEITLNRYVHSSNERKIKQMALLFDHGQSSGTVAPNC